MNSRSYPFVVYFLLLPILQVMVFDQFNLGVQLVPQITLLFLIFYPTDAEQTIFLVIAFLYGLYSDLLHSTMVIKAAACLTAAFLRPTIITSVFQTILNVIDYGMGMQEAVDSKKFHHQWLPDVLVVEEKTLSGKDQTKKKTKSTSKKTTKAKKVSKK